MSKIEWTNKTWNPVTGCTKISEGCLNCYAEKMSKRLAGRCGYPKEKPFSIVEHPDKLDKPGTWKKPCVVFVCSMGDLFHEDVDFDYILRIFGRMNHFKQHTFQVLTKRPERMLQFFRDYGLIPDPLTGFTGSGETIPENIWAGVTVENQEQADKRIPILAQLPTKVRFISVEPMLEHIQLSPALSALNGAELFRNYLAHLHWVICGGETGPGARPINHEWVNNLHQQCVNAKVPFFFKKWGAWWPNKAGDNSGNLIDGKVFQEMPEVK